MKNALAMHTGCILLALAPMTGATPIVAIRTPSEIVVGTNTKDTGGYPHCKLFTNSSVAIIRASNLTRFLLHGEVAFDSGVGIWKAMEGNPDIDQLQGRIVKSLEDSAAEFVRLRPRMNIEDQKPTNADFLRSLDTHILIVTSDKAVVKMHALLITFSGWPRPVAIHKLEGIRNNSQSITLLTWTRTDPGPSLEYRKFIDQSAMVPSIEGRLAQIAAVVQQNKDPMWRSFSEPFVTANIDASGVRWLSGASRDHAMCDEERQAALRQ